jgi:hypothetical protein
LDPKLLPAQRISQPLEQFLPLFTLRSERFYFFLQPGYLLSGFLDFYLQILKLRLTHRPGKLHNLSSFQVMKFFFVKIRNREVFYSARVKTGGCQIARFAGGTKS